MAGKSLQAAVVGLGNVGFEVAKQIAMMPAPENPKYLIGELVLFSRDKKKADISRQVLNGLKAPGITVASSHVSTLSDFLPDIVINCASVPEAKNYRDRRKMGELNLELNREISSLIPDDSLEIIVTNHVLALAQDAVFSCGRNPEMTVGCAQVDSIRAGIAIEERLAGAVKGSLDKRNVFIIGSHDDNEMVLAYSTSTVNNILLKELGSVASALLDIENYAANLAHMQIMARQTTNELTAKAVTETLAAVLTEKSYVSAGILCDFGHEFFRADPDYFKFEKPAAPTYLVVRAGFRELKAGFAAGDDISPEVGWFAGQAEGTKKAFYDVAVRQHNYLDSLKKKGLIP